MGSAHGSPKSAPECQHPILKSKGFAGGVPLNTETTAVKPRVGIEAIAKRCLFFVEMARAGSVQTLPALSFVVPPPGGQHRPLPTATSDPGIRRLKPELPTQLPRL